MLDHSSGFWGIDGRFVAGRALCSTRPVHNRLGHFEYAGHIDCGVANSPTAGHIDTATA